MQIRRYSEPARGVPNRRLHHIGARKRAEAVQRLAPPHQIARRGDRGGANRVLASDRVHVARRGFWIGRVGRRPSGERGHALVVDHDMVAAGEADMRHAAAQHASHHRLDDGQGEERGDRGIDGVAAGGDHFGSGGRGERVVGDDHASAPRGGLLFALEGRAGAVAPVRLRHGGASWTVSGQHRAGNADWEGCRHRRGFW